MLVQDLQSSGESVRSSAVCMDLRHSESSSNEPVRLLREYWGICLFNPGLAVSLGRDFLFRVAWPLPTPPVQHKGFGAMAQLAACSQLEEILGASQVPLAAITFLPPILLVDQPR